MVETPELDKIKAVREESQKIGGFLDWLIEEKRFRVCELVQEDEYDNEVFTWYPVGHSIEQLLASYFEIDLKKVEEEKQAVLDEFNESQK